MEERIPQFCEASIAMISKLDKGITRKAHYISLYTLYILVHINLYGLISLIKTHAKMPANQIHQPIKSIVQHDQLGFIPGLQRGLHMKITQCNIPY